MIVHTGAAPRVICFASAFMITNIWTYVIELRFDILAYLMKWLLKEMTCLLINVIVLFKVKSLNLFEKFGTLHYSPSKFVHREEYEQI